MGIAFKNAGYEIAGAWDFDKYAVETYRANVGDHVQKADIKELHQADIPQADVWAAAVKEETTALPIEKSITPEILAAGMLHFLFDAGIIARACVTEETTALFTKHIKDELDGMTIREQPEAFRDWTAAENAVNDILSKYTPSGYMGKIIYPVLLPLKERLEAGERTADLFNAIVEATR